MAVHPFKKDLAVLQKHYSRLLRDHGDTPQAVQQRDMKTQERRMAILSEVGDLNASKVLDFGCGTGHLLEFLRKHIGFNGEYVGYDISTEMIATAKEKYPEIRFEKKDILDDGMTEEFDYILVSGVFNNRTSDNWGLMTTILRKLFPGAKKALAFNALSTYVDYFEPSLFYVNPQQIFQFCKEELSPCVILRHDYMIKLGIVPYEFSVFVYKAEIQPRRMLISK